MTRGHRVFSAFALLVGAVLLLGTGSPAAAQQQRLLGAFLQFSMLRLPPPVMEQLKLTDDQKSKVREIQTSLGEQRRTAFQEAQTNGGNFQEALQKLVPVMEKADTDAVALLTPDQKKTFDGLKARHANFVGLGPHSSMALLLVDGLTDEENSKLKALGTETLTNVRAAATAGGNPLEGIRKAFAEAEDGVRKLLTTDQTKQFDEILKKIPAQPGRPNAAAQ